MEITPLHFLIVAFAVFSAGAAGVLLRRDAVGAFMCIEVMLGGVSLAFVTFARFYNNHAGQIVVLTIVAIAATEAAIGLALMIIYNRHKKNVSLEEMNTLKG